MTRVEHIHTGTCHYCGHHITWTTAEWEPSDSEAPFDERGNYCCDTCYHMGEES